MPFTTKLRSYVLAFVVLALWPVLTLAQREGGDIVVAQIGVEASQEAAGPQAASELLGAERILAYESALASDRWRLAELTTSSPDRSQLLETLSGQVEAVTAELSAGRSALDERPARSKGEESGTGQDNDVLPGGVGPDELERRIEALSREEALTERAAGFAFQAERTTREIIRILERKIVVMERTNARLRGTLTATPPEGDIEPISADSAGMKEPICAMRVRRATWRM